MENSGVNPLATVSSTPTAKVPATPAANSATPAPKAKTPQPNGAKPSVAEQKPISTKNYFVADQKIPPLFSEKPSGNGTGGEPVAKKASRIIPPNFDKPWFRSNVVLATQEKKALYANKEVLAVFSPYFEALFFTSELSKKDDNVANVDVELPILLEMLRILHHMNKKEGTSESQSYTLETLEKLYRASDQYDIPVVREMMRDQLSQTHTKAAFKVAHDLGLVQERNQILKELPTFEVELCLQEYPQECFHLTNGDVAELIRKNRNNSHRRNSKYWGN